MTDSIVPWVLLVLLLGWMVGAYNRLVRLRAQAVAAFQPLGDTLARYVALVDACAASAAGMAHGHAMAAWVSLQAAGTQFDASLRVARRLPLDANGMAALQTALTVLQAAWQRVQREFPDHPYLLSAAGRGQWAEADQMGAHAAGIFNRAVEAYNQGIAQFPALLLARLFAFRAGGCL